MGTLNATFNGRSPTDTSNFLINKMMISSLKHSDPLKFEASIIKHLETQLKYATRDSTDGSTCPLYVSHGDTRALYEHAELAKHRASINDFEESCASIWSLCVALWGEQEFLEGVPDTEHLSIMVRRELLSQWLETQIENKHSKREVSKNYLEDMLFLMTSHKITEACDLAHKNGDINLSLLLSQCEGNKIVRMLIKMQLESWKNSEADKFISSERLKTMMLIGGIELFDSTEGNINIYEAMDWLRALAVR